MAIFTQLNGAIFHTIQWVFGQLVSTQLTTTDGFPFGHVVAGRLHYSARTEARNNIFIRDRTARNLFTH